MQLYSCAFIDNIVLGNLMKKNYDLTVIGAGLVGSICALSMAQLGLKVALFDNRPKHLLFSNNNDIRTVALSYNSSNFLRNLLQGESIPSLNGAAPIEGIVVHHRDVNKYHNQSITFNSDMVHNVHPLGYQVCVADLKNDIFHSVTKHRNIDIIDNFNITGVQNDPFYSGILGSKSGENSVINDIEIRSNLSLVCDGFRSSIREKLNIATYTKNYHQKALIFFIKHHASHENIARQIFCENGQITIMPMPIVDDYITSDKNRSAAIWTLSDKSFILNKDDKISIFQEYIADIVGEIERFGDMSSYNLHMNYSGEYSLSRFLLLGDALHFMHPIVGLGFNIHIYDIKKLISMVERSLKFGLDFGDRFNLDQFKRNTKSHSMTATFCTDMLNCAFTNHSKYWQKIRGMGMNMFDKSYLLKKNLLGYMTM